jgi:hypothetical protein
VLIRNRKINHQEHIGMSSVWRGFAGFLMLLSATSSDAALVSYDLNQSSDLSDGRAYLRVTIDDNGAPGRINFHVFVLGSLLGFADRNFGIDGFGFNSDFSLSSSRIVGLPKNWKYGGSETVDDFGRFDATVEAKNAGARVQSLSFSIAGIKLDTISSYLESSSGHARAGNFFFVAHVDGLDAPEFRCFDDAYFAGSQPALPLPAPLPASAWLLLAGLGLLAFTSRGGVGRRGLFSHSGMARSGREHD